MIIHHRTHALTAWDAMEKCTRFTHQHHPLSPSLKAHTPGSSCPLPSTPTRGAPVLFGAALPLLPDPPSPPPAPSRCLLPVQAISLFFSGCVDTLPKGGISRAKNMGKTALLLRMVALSAIAAREGPLFPCHLLSAFCRFHPHAARQVSRVFIGPLACTALLSCLGSWILRLSS